MKISFFENKSINNCFKRGKKRERRPLPVSPDLGKIDRMNRVESCEAPLAAGYGTWRFAIECTGRVGSFNHQRGIVALLASNLSFSL